MNEHTVTNGQTAPNEPAVTNGHAAPNGHAARPRVYGDTVDAETRCVHYAGPTDIVAIKFRCCDRFYPCFQCHADAETHPAEQWAPGEWHEPAILCGACGHTLTIQAYRAVSACPVCASAFNDGCRLHAHLYFQVPAAPAPTPPR